MKKTIAISTTVVAILVLSVGAVAAAYSPGTLVDPADDDRSIPTALLPGGFAPISFIDSNGNLVCDIDEPVYVDTGGLGAGVVSVGDIRLTEVVRIRLYPAGTQVLNLDLDVMLPLTPLLPIQQNILIVDADSNSLYSVGDWLYLDINGDNLVSGSGAGPLGADLRLTDVPLFGYDFGTKVTTLDDDADLIPLLILVPGPGPAGWRLDYVDNVGTATYTPGDTVYCKLPLPQHGVLNVLTCDLRITEYPF